MTARQVIAPAPSFKDDHEGLPAPIGVPLAIVATTIEHAYDRAHAREHAGFLPNSCGDPTKAGTFVEDLAPSAVLVDTGVNSALLCQVVATVRRSSKAPILAVGVSGAIPEMAQCFESGADDYVHPEASDEEIDLRLRALLRRGALQGKGLRATTVSIGELVIDHVARTVTKNGRDVALSPTEFRLLSTLAESPGEIMASKALIARVWGSEYSEETHYLRLYVRYLRQKLEDDPSNPVYIVNRWGAGYTLAEPSQAA